MNCGKKKFDKIKAMLIIAEALNSLDSKRQEKRYYYCEKCKGYHVTSKDFKILRVIYKDIKF